MIEAHPKRQKSRLLDDDIPFQYNQCDVTGAGIPQCPHLK